MGPLMLELSNVVVQTRRGVRLADGVDLTVGAGEIVGLVGESGSGKTVTTTAVFGLAGPGVRVTGGTATLDGADLAGLDLRKVRGRDVGFVFQDPSTALHPLHRVGDQIAEAAKVHGRRVDVRAALADVGVPDPARRARQYPHELSGGLRQRVAIAMALANRPRLVVADEPTTALDVTVQMQVLRLLDRLRAEGTATLLITHDLGLVAEIADRVAVMYAGRIVETAAVAELFAAPRHPYTRALLASRPDLRAGRTTLPVIGGAPPSPASRPPGCAFHPRCPVVLPQCPSVVPSFVDGVACHEVHS
ncbi:ABC transporter ATP-binding protein [Dactylosporangium sp. AC04546]|uniref:ABC transporter ATP-binding protein n=1 Tax=Dactylosporangium sp. AC04546 TaxID=2862460 RepID=UPI001EDF8553|nr:ABC transporter ATP-binding protein [Dactylosporangium sp. AC04546]WVK78441.1 ABC transporter ATP-binding protein [Dactylosporangium sp. AC04546]